MSFVNDDECAEKEIERLDEMIEDANKLKENRNLVVSIQSSTRTRSIAREYFGMLKDIKKGIVVDKYHVYCKMCFVHPNGRKIYRYKKAVSTGNLLSHLREEHNINSTHLSNEKINIRRFFESHRQSEQLGKSQKITDKKKELIDSITVWFCRDFLSFHEIEKDGLKDFFKLHGIVQNESDLPHPSTLSRNSLSRVYNDCVFAVKTKINEDNPSAISLTMDAWTDNYRHIPFMTFTLHWISPTETKLRSCTLQTNFFPHPHTADNIVEELKKVLTEFNLNSKIITLITDGGSNMIKAARDMKVSRVPCVAHGLHNLVMVDTLISK